MRCELNGFIHQCTDSVHAFSTIPLVVNAGVPIRNPLIRNHYPPINDTGFGRVLFLELGLGVGGVHGNPCVFMVRFINYRELFWRVILVFFHGEQLWRS